MKLERIAHKVHIRFIFSGKFPVCYWIVFLGHSKHAHALIIQFAYMLKNFCIDFRRQFQGCFAIIINKTTIIHFFCRI